MQTDRHEQFVLIDKLLAGAASPEEERGLRVHLQNCATCQQYMEVSSRAIAGLNGFSFEMTPGLNAQVQSAIAQRIHELEVERPRRSTLRTFAAALALTVAGSLFAWSFSGKLADGLNLSTSQLQIGLLIFWVVPSLCVSLLILAAPRLMNGQLNKEGWTA